MPQFTVSEHYEQRLPHEILWTVEVTVQGYRDSITYAWTHVEYQPTRREWQISCFRQHLQTCASRHADPQSIFEELSYAVREYDARAWVPGEEMKFMWWLAKLPTPPEES